MTLFFLLIQFEKVAILIKKSRRQEKFRAEYIEFVVEVHLTLILRISVFLACHGAKKRRKKFAKRSFSIVLTRNIFSINIILLDNVFCDDKILFGGAYLWQKQHG